MWRCLAADVCQIFGRSSLWKSELRCVLPNTDTPLSGTEKTARMPNITIGEGRSSLNRQNCLKLNFCKFPNILYGKDLRENFTESEVWGDLLLFQKSIDWKFHFCRKPFCFNVLRHLMKSRPSVQGSLLFVSTNIFQPISHACDACFYSVKCNFAKVQLYFSKPFYWLQKYSFCSLAPRISAFFVLGWAGLPFLVFAIFFARLQWSRFSSSSQCHLVRHFCTDNILSRLRMGAIEFLTGPTPIVLQVLYHWLYNLPRRCRTMFLPRLFPWNTFRHSEGWQFVQ